MAAVLGTGITEKLPVSLPVWTRTSRGTANGVGPAKSKQHSRQVSYGTFIPVYVIDSEYLKSLLGGKETACELSEPASAKSTHSAFPSALTHQSSSDSDQSLCSSEPALSTAYSSINGTYQPDFFTECELQVKKLFIFMELHLSKLEDDLAHVVKRREMRERTKSEGEDDGRDEDEITEKSGLLDSGIEEDHLQTELGMLQRLKDVGFHLLESLQNSFASLDELMQVHDDSYLSEDGREFLQSKLVKKDELQGRLNTCVTSINSELKHYDQDSKDVRIDGLGASDKRREIFDNVRATPISCFTYLYFLLFLVVMGVLSWMSFIRRPTWIVYLRLVRSPLLMVMYFYLLGVNMKTWARAGIDYIGIFNYPPKGVPTPKYAFKVGGMFTVFFSILVAVLLTSGYLSEDIIGKVITFVMWLSLLGFIINPMNHYLRRGRLSFVLVCVRVLSAPFHFVHFGDFWFADQLNSTVAILLDIQYFLCYLSVDTWTKPVDARICTSSTNGIRPVISCLPALWRFLQCLRCYYDTRQIKHLINAGKYSTTFPVVVFAALFSVKVPSTFSLTELDLSDVGWIVLCWLFFSFLHTIYTFIWDVYCDWGLFRFSKCTILRPNRLYKWRILYCLAIFADLILRFAWVVKLTLAIVWHLDSDLLYTGLVVGEISRRFIWNFFRVEFEQVCRMYPD